MEVRYLWHIEPEKGPIYAQIAAEVKRMLARGELAPGGKLPSARTLAEEARVNPNTVVHAYAELEREGITETRRGLGTFVREDVDVEAIRRRELEAAARAYLRTVRALGMDLNAAREVLEEVGDAP
ncbi:GntR family transcriptional regulator [Oceanithermus profundus]|uniref:GntR family transcriptional regulator n=1 Tax=Oceanithermus profundus TaxID=187137 RepID=UPI000305E757|nr:GntR family transcriptional regulator [Oceanithermus profundus]